MTDTVTPPQLAALLTTPVAPVERLPHGDPRILEAIRAGDRPIIITGSPVAAPAVARWGDFAFWCEHAGGMHVSVRRTAGPFHYAVTESNQAKYNYTYPVTIDDDVRFTHFAKEFADVTERDGGRAPFALPAGEAFAATPTGPQNLASLLAATPVQRSLLPQDAQEALATHLAAKAAEGATWTTRPPPQLVYLQTVLSMERIVPHPTVLKDVQGFDWKWIEQASAGWGAMSSNLFLVGTRGAITPAHYDEMHNMFAQLRGRKLFVLAPPADWARFRPFPLGHPSDRQAQLDLRWPDEGVAGANLSYAVVGPGDVLYLPALWWHHVESPWEDTASLNFWFKQTNGALPPLPLRDPSALVSLRRNLEKIAGAALGYPASTAMFAKLGAAAAGRKAVLTPAESQCVSQLSGMLKAVLPESEIAGFLRELGRGRFELPRLGTERGNSGGSPNMKAASS